MENYEARWLQMTPGVCREIIEELRAEIGEGVTDARRVQLEHRMAVLERLAKEYDNA
jgi:hypothetical protein